MVTKDPVFTEYVHQHLQNIMRKSTLMSQVGEKDRRKYFNFCGKKLRAASKAFDFINTDLI